MSLVMRYQWESYMDCGTASAPDFNLIGEGFTSFPEAKNPKEYTRKYVNDKTERSDVIGYSPSISYSCDVITDNPVVSKIVAITDQEAVGDETHVDIVSVNLWEGTADSYVAYKRTYAIIPDGKGDGTDALIYTGTMKAVGDIVIGTFSRTSKTFSANTAE